jgi:hypothetical protein
MVYSTKEILSDSMILLIPSTDTPSSIVDMVKNLGYISYRSLENENLLKSSALKCIPNIAYSFILVTPISQE